MNQDDIITKIKAIMRLARRAGTEGEKTAAESAAKRLADKAGIALEEIEVTDADAKSEYDEDGTLYERNATEIAYITAVLRRHFGVIPIQNRAGSARRVRFSWIGTKINIAVAKHVYVFLMRECRKAWAEVRVAKVDARKLHYRDPARERQLVALRNLSQKAFYDGWFSVIHQKLTEHPLRNDVEQFEAEKKSAEEMLNKIKEQMNVTEQKKESTAKDKTSAILGYNAAQSVNLSRPCESGPWSRPCELTSR